MDKISRQLVFGGMAVFLLRFMPGWGSTVFAVEVNLSELRRKTNQ